jgi:hypothetical protein
MNYKQPQSSDPTEMRLRALALSFVQKKMICKHVNLTSYAIKNLWLVALMLDDHFESCRLLEKIDTPGSRQHCDFYLVEFSLWDRDNLQHVILCVWLLLTAPRTTECPRTWSLSQREVDGWTPICACSLSPNRVSRNLEEQLKKSYKFHCVCQCHVFGGCWIVHNFSESVVHVNKHLIHL